MAHRREALMVTTTTHAYVIALYSLLAFLGGLHVTEVAAHTAMVNLVGEPWSAVWSLMHVLAGLCALFGALAARFMANPAFTLWIEAAGIAGLVAVYALYTLALWKDFGLTGVMVTQVFGWTVVLGGVARIAQIVVETRRIRQAVADPAPANPPPLAVADEF